jgi:capsular polysaccharide biosynthesis protein
MELLAIWKLVRRRWWLIALPALAAFVITLPSLPDVVSPPVSHLVQIRLTAAAPPGDSLEGTVTTPYEDAVYVPLLASEYVVVNMPHWITSDSFVDEVKQVLRAQDHPAADEDLSGAFAADGFRSILTLYVVWDDAEAIRDIASAAITVLQTRNQAYFPQFAAEPVEVIALDSIDVTDIAPPITARIGPLLRIMIGLAAGVGLAVLAEYLDRSIHTRDDIEAIGLTVLAEIPRE